MDRKANKDSGCRGIRCPASEQRRAFIDEGGYEHAIREFTGASSSGMTPASS